MRLLPLFKFTLMRPDTLPEIRTYRLQRIEDFKKRIGNEYLTLSCRESNIAPDTLVMLDKGVCPAAQERRHVVDPALRTRRPPSRSSNSTPIR